jgi:branched-chain amino acid transport system substrate-binding protein
MIMRMKVFCSVLQFLLILIVAKAVFAAAAAPPTIPIGVPLSLSGRLSNLGNQCKAGYDIGVEEINRTGGVFVKEYGKKIPLELIVQDTESEPVKAVGRMEWLYASRKVIAYIGEGLITNGQGAAEKNKVPALAIASPHQSPHDRGLKYWFSPFAKSPDVARFICDVLETVPADKRPRTAAIFQENTDWGVEMAEAFKKEVTQRGYKVAAFEKYQIMTKDLSPLIMSAKNAGADMLLTSPVAPDGMTMMRQMKELDYNPKAIAVIRAAEDLSWGKALGPMGDYVMLSGMSWHHAVKFPGVDKLNAAFQAKFGRPGDLMTGSAYASIQIIAAAVEKAGTLDTTKIRDAIAATDMMTVIGRVRFRPNGTLIDPSPVVVQWIGGSQKLISPKEFAETSFVYPVPAWKDR